MNKAVRQMYKFGPFVLDPGERLVRHGASRMELPPRAFDTLAVLVENNGRLLEKDELMRTVWGDTVVEENNLSQVVYLLRKALRDGEDGARYIETVPKRGYRFVAEVREFEPAENSQSRNGISSFGPPASSSYSANHQTPAVASEPAAARADRSDLEPPGGNSRARRWMQGLVGGLAIIAVVTLLEGTGWKRKLFGEAAASPIRSVAVLPLQNLSNDPDQEYFVDGMTDELITDLAQIRELKVVSKTSIMQYKATRTPLPQIGRDLGVDAVVEGSVLRSGDRVRITAQLIRTATDRHIWAEAYDGDLKDVLSLQARVAEAITNQVKLNLSAEESGRLRTAHAVNPEAFDLYLRGRYAWNQRNLEGFQRAIQYFNQAIEKDPNFALAYSGLADSYTLLALYGAGATGINAAKSATERALQLDGTLAEAHTSLAAVKILHDWDWQGSEQEFRRAIELNPNSAQAHHWYGNLLLGPEGRHEEAIAELLRAQELDPLSPIIKADTGFAYFLAGRYNLALQEYQQVLAANPNFVPVHFYLSKYYRQTGQYGLWLKETIEDQSLAGLPNQVQSLQQVYDQGGFQAAMEEMAKPKGSSKLAAFKDVRLDSCAAAEADAVLGRNVAALNALEECHRWSETALIYLKVDPVWTNLRPEPRFQGLLRRLRLQ
ncbi:MAG TPA: tetratricopeptide repeat protein [Candidatus Acidoferrum sp.]|jgi:TolB-like protein/DNA-binding winged helix-turn-helix (wHTH) protein|nr:tetratricopeptide repeat protein [Candidatus Acidoferrum sp.]